LELVVTSARGTLCHQDTVRGPRGEPLRVVRIPCCHPHQRPVSGLQVLDRCDLVGEGSCGWECPYSVLSEGSFGWSGERGDCRSWHRWWDNDPIASFAFVAANDNSIRKVVIAQIVRAYMFLDAGEVVLRVLSSDQRSLLALLFGGFSMGALVKLVPTK
jgi:hypothetical protein